MEGVNPPSTANWRLVLSTSMASERRGLLRFERSNISTDGGRIGALVPDDEEDAKGNGVQEGSLKDAGPRPAGSPGKAGLAGLRVGARMGRGRGRGCSFPLSLALGVLSSPGFCAGGGGDEASLSSESSEELGWACLARLLSR